MPTSPFRCVSLHIRTDSLTSLSLHFIMLLYYKIEEFLMKYNLFALILLYSFLLSGCNPLSESILPEETSASVTTEAVTVPSAIQPLHSELYLSDYSPDQIFAWFEEVVLDMEYSEGDGDITLVQKWMAPIGFRVYGNPTEEDLAVLNAFFAQLNRIPGFPGFYTAEAEGQEHMQIHFLDENVFAEGFSSVVNGEDAYGATQFWYYNQTNEIHTARVGCRGDISQSERNSVLMEEIVNALGISDTFLREDSITYQYSNENTALSDVDWTLLKLLYHPDVKCGMDREQCASVIQKLYY